MRLKPSVIWRLLVDRATRKIAFFGPAEGFVAPDTMFFVNADGACEIQAEQCESINWVGALPKGFTPQTCFQFRFDDGNPVEEIPTTENDALVL
jgi:hypothetical protein